MVRNPNKYTGKPPLLTLLLMLKIIIFFFSFFFFFCSWYDILQDFINSINVHVNVDVLRNIKKMAQFQNGQK